MTVERKVEFFYSKTCHVPDIHGASLSLYIAAICKLETFKYVLLFNPT